MLDIDELKKRIRLEASTMDELPPSSSPLSSNTTNTPVSSSRITRLQSFADRIHCGSILKFFAWLVRPWRVLAQVQSNLQVVETKLTELQDLQASDSTHLHQKIPQERSLMQRELILCRQQAVLQGYELNRLMDDLKNDGELKNKRNNGTLQGIGSIIHKIDLSAG